MNPISPFPARRRKAPSTLLSYLWSGVTGLFDIRWLLGMRPAHLERPAPKDTTVSAVIPAHNEVGQLRPAVTSLLKQNYPLFSIIIVENGSIDGTVEIADELARENPGLVYVLHTPALGSKARALNAGLASGLPFGELMIEMDADTEFAPDAIEKLLPHFYDPAVAVACGTVFLQPYSGDKPSVWWLSKRAEYLVGQGLTKEAQNAFGAIVVSAGCFSMFVTSLIGTFSDETMAEDMQKTWELQLQGWKAVYEPNSLCYAAEPQTWKVYRGQRWRWLCGFLQCYLLLVRDLFKYNVRLAVVVHYMFAMALADVVLVPLGIYIYTNNPELAVLLPSLLDLGTMLFVLSCYAYRLGGMRLMLQSLSFRSILSALVGSLMNRCIFLCAIVSEWILGRRLTKWQSGHTQTRASLRTHNQTATKTMERSNVEDSGDENFGVTQNSGPNSGPNYVAHAGSAAGTPCH